MDRQKTLHSWQERISQELDSVVDFWLRHSHDKEYGWASVCEMQLLDFLCSASQADAVGLEYRASCEFADELSKR